MNSVRVVCLLFLSLLSGTAMQFSGRKCNCASAQTAAATPGAVPASDRTRYAGDGACLTCHRDQALSYQHTGHHLTSQKSSKDTILGSFAPGSNTLMIANPPQTDVDPRLYFKLEAKSDGYYQTAVAERGEQRLTKSERIDIVVGSGVRGQTYLFWSDNRLYELPLSYWSEGHRWINSPGYKDGTANFARHVDPRCLECHATYIKPLSDDPQTNVYDKSSLVLGVSCETCHGMGADHVRMKQREPRNQSPPGESSIVNPSKFDRDAQVDLCALCHGGTQRKETSPTFSYVPGKPLDQYFEPPPAGISEQADVHGNQVGLLQKSRCFLSSPTMSCSTCHNVHAPEKPAQEYSTRCLKCHRWNSCGMSKTIGRAIVRNCIDCHMPIQPSNAIVSDTAGTVVRARMRTHWIGIYQTHVPDPVQK